MEVRNISKKDMITEHHGTCFSWILFDGEKDKLGGGIEFVSEFEIRAGDTMEPHSHNMEEFYYVLYGRGKMNIGAETRDVAPGDLIRIPPNVVHSINTVGKDNPVHSLCFAVGLEKEK